MKIYILPLALLSLMSCSSFRYGTISSNLSTGSDGAMSFENDSVRVDYYFKGEDLPVKVRIYNKTSAPLNVHWDKSSVIVNGESVPFRKTSSTLTATSETSQFPTAGLTSTSNIVGEIHPPEPVSFVAPASFVESTVQSPIFQLYLQDIGKDVRAEGAGRASERIFTRRYAAAESPLVFRVYLSYSFEQHRLKFVDNQFWLSSLVLPGQRPSLYPGFLGRTDTFYTTIPNYTGLVIGGAAGTAAMVLLLKTAADEVNDF